MRWTKLFGTYYTLEEEESYEENYTLGCHRFLEMYKNIESNYYNVHFTETVETSHDFNDDSDKYIEYRGNITFDLS